MILALSLLNVALIVALVAALVMLRHALDMLPLQVSLYHWLRNDGGIFRCRWRDRFGHMGLKGWFIGQWRRLTGFRPDYRMSPESRPRKDIPLTEMYGAVCGVGEDGVEWGHPAFLGVSQRMAIDFSQDRTAGDLRHMNEYNFADLSDEQLDERSASAKLGTGELSAIGYEKFRRGQNAPSDTDFVSDEGRGVRTPPPLDDNISPADTSEKPEDVYPMGEGLADTVKHRTGSTISESRKKEAKR